MSADEANLSMSETEDPNQYQAPNDAPQMGDVLRGILGDLHRSTTDISLSLIASNDGLAMITQGNIDDEDHAAAVCAELTALCQQAANDFRVGTINLVLTRGAEGSIILFRVNSNAMLALTVHPDANLGFVLLEGERAAEAIAAAL